MVNIRDISEQIRLMILRMLENRQNHNQRDTSAMSKSSKHSEIEEYSYRKNLKRQERKRRISPFGTQKTSVP